MPANQPRRARAIGVLLWVLLWSAVVTVILMTWHPWVIGSRTGCAPGAARAWDGNCYPGNKTP